MSKLKPGWQLFTVLRVEKSERIRCECPGCHFKIYATIIVLVWPGTEDIQFWGKDCFARESGKPYNQFPPFLNERYDSEGRKLTEDERQLLDVNRAALVALLRDENEALKQVRLEQEALQRKIDEDIKAHREALRRQRKEAERARLRAEEAKRARLKAEEAERARLRAEEAERARLRAEEAERARLRAEEAKRARLRAEEAERARLRAEEAERARLRAEEAERARLSPEEKLKETDSSEPRFLIKIHFPITDNPEFDQHRVEVIVTNMTRTKGKDRFQLHFYKGGKHQQVDFPQGIHYSDKLHHALVRIFPHNPDAVEIELLDDAEPPTAKQPLVETPPKFKAIFTLHQSGRDQVQDLMTETLSDAKQFITTNIKPKWVGEVIDLETGEVIYQITDGKVFVDR